MEIISNAFTWQLVVTALGASMAPVILALINRSEKERNRKGLHPITKGLIVFAVVFAAFAAGIAIGKL